MSQLAQGLRYTPGGGGGSARKGRHTPGRNGFTPRRTPSRNSNTPGHVGNGDGNSSSSGHIKVVVRVRPLNSQEIEGNYKNIVEVLDDHMLVFDPKEQNSPDYYHRKRRQGRDMFKKANRDIRFAFDQVYGDSSTNVEVYERTTKAALDALLDGFNCSVFAYGATGAGKTFTMLGRPDHPGVMFLTMMDLYSMIDAMKETKSCDVAVSYMEVYNEQIRDLLMPTGFLPIREDPEKGVMISGLSLHKPRSAEELMHMLEFGNKNRTQHPTDANAESSRSHAVFQVFVRMKDRTAGLSADVTVAKMSLIDLAGSERATVTTNRGARFREGANINRSLLALGNCINALAEGKSKGYIPYRNSKLTRLLKDSLGGNCKTVMIAAVSPSAMSYEDTYNTLKYANRAKNIKANLTRKVVSVDYHVTKYVQIVEELRTEVAELKEKLSQYESGAIIPSKSSRLDDLNMQEISRIRGLLLSVFEERISIRKELMEMEASYRDIAFKIHLKQISIDRIKILITDPAEVEQATAKFEKAVTGFKERQETIGKRKHAIEARIDENNTRLERAEGEMKDVQKSCSVPELLDTELRCRHLEVELRDTRRHVRHLKKLCRQQQRSAKANEEVVNKLLRTVKNQYFILKGHGLATSDINEQFENLQQLIEGKTVVNFDETVKEKSLMSVSELDPLPSSQKTQFDINELVEFPVLSCVPITPKTPHRAKSRLSCSTSSFAMTPKTPITPGGPVTPVTPVWQDSSNTSLGVTPSVSCASEVTTSTYDAGRSTSSSSSSSSCSNSLVGGDAEQQNHSQLISKAIASTVQQCLNISTMSHASTMDSSNVSHLSKVDSSRALSSGSSIRTVANSKEQSSNNGRCNSVSSDVSNVRVYGANSKAVTHKRPVETTVRDNNPVTPAIPEHNIDETFTFDTTVEGVFPLKSDSDSPRPALVDRTSIMQNAGTVTKERSTVEAPVVNSSTVTKTTINSGTVTKSKAAPSDTHKAPAQDMIKVIEAAGLRECNTPPNDRRTSVVRSFNFDGIPCPSPTGRLTFAEALKSPAPLKMLKNDTFRIGSPRSPLMARTNLPDLTPEERFNTNNKVSFAEDVHFNKERHASTKKRRQHHPYSASKAKRFQEPRSSHLPRHHSVYVGRSQVSEDVKRMGLPSILEKRDKLILSSASSSTSDELPGYMQLTKAASRRRKNHQISSLHEESEDRAKTLIPSVPKRVASKENSKPAPNRIMMPKSKSAINIGQKSTFF